MTLYRRSALAGFSLVLGLATGFTLWSDWIARDQYPRVGLPDEWPWNTRP